MPSLAPSVQASITRLDNLVVRYNGLAGSPYQQSVILRMRQAIVDIAPTSIYAERANGPDAKDDDILLCTLSLEEDLKDGYGVKPFEFAHAEIFSDYLDSAEDSLSHGKVISAAIEAGVTCEAHIKQLASIHGIPLLSDPTNPKSYVSAADLNTALRQRNVYDLATYKMIDGWQTLRNDAAHGKIIITEQGKKTLSVKMMIEGLRGFIANHPV